MTDRMTVFVVDDEADVRDSLRYLLESADFRVETYASAGDFLDAYTPDTSGVLVLDLRMAGMSGLELQQALRAKQYEIPIIVLTGHGDVPLAVQAMKDGAMEFLQKPINDHVLIDCIRNASRIDEQNRRRKAEHDAILKRIASLTPRQKQVMDLVVAGKSSKRIADELCVAVKTIEVHRKFILAKMKAESTVDLVTMVHPIRGKRAPR